MNAREYPSCFAGYWYDRMAADGREQLLFGSHFRDLVVKAVEASLLDGSTFGLFSEFPLVGDPFLDVTVYSVPEAPGFSPVFLHGNGFGYAPLVQFCATEKQQNTCFEFDLSAGEPFSPNVVVFPDNDQLKDETYLHRAISLMGHEDRAERVFDVLRRTPNGWAFNYFGGYNRRAEQPLRLAFKVSVQQTSIYREQPQRFLTDIAALGYPAACEDMLPALRIFLEYNQHCEVGVDLLPDGHLGPTLGLLNGLEHPVRNFFNGQALMESRNAAYLAALEHAGYIDARWRSAMESVFAVRTRNLFDPAEYVQQHGLHSVKLRWRNGQLLPTKMYTGYRYNPVPK